MKEPYGEGLASHTGSESCAYSRKAGSEALTGAHAGGVWRLIRAAFAVRLRLGDPRVVPCFRCTFLLDMPPITTTRSPSVACTQFFTDDVSLRRKQSGSALLGFPSSASDGVCFTRLPWFAFATACRIAGPPGGSDQAFRPANGGFYSRAFHGSVALPVVGV